MDKIDQLLDAIEHPEHYTPTEIEAMFQNHEVKDTFELIDKTKSSLQHIVVPNVDDEWRSFENNHRNSGVSHSFTLRNVLSRNIAASITIGVLSFTAMATIVGVGIHCFNNSQVAEPEVEFMNEAELLISPSDTIRSFEDGKIATAEIMFFDEETLETILSEIATYYDCKVIFNNDASKTLRLYFRWDKALPINDVIERLNNFEQIHITVKDSTINVDR